MTLILICLAIGALSGLLAGLLGVGGGIVLVPALTMVYLSQGTEPAYLGQMIAATSMAVMIGSTTLSAWRHAQKGYGEWSLLRWMMPMAAIGAIGGVMLTGFLSSLMMRHIFGGVLIGISLFLAAGKPEFTLRKTMPPKPVAGLMGFLVGMLSGILGIAGGIIMTPLQLLCGVPARLAIANAVWLAPVISLVSAIGYVIAGWQFTNLANGQLGYIDLTKVALLMPTALLAVPLGVWLSHKCPQNLLRRLFGLFLIPTGLKMLGVI